MSPGKIATSNALTTKLSQQCDTKNRSRHLRTVAYDSIKEAILDGALQVDQPLVEERLAAALGISRTPVREALIILEHETLLHSIAGKGLFVRAITIDELLGMLDALEVVEATLSSRAAELATDEQIAQMYGLLGEAEKYARDNVFTHFSKLRGFLRVLGESASNRHLAKFLITNEEKGDLYVIRNQHLLSVDKLLSSVQDRKRIVDAIRDRDSQRAALCAREHSRAARTRWQTLSG